MTTGFHTATAGMLWSQKALDVTANNISNLTTSGYKANKASFADLLYTEVKQPEVDPPLKVGHGSKINKTDTVFSAAALTQTNKPQDYALTDTRNFFAVRTPDGRIVYTRGGSFQLSRHADGLNYLADSAGNEVLDPNGNSIVVTDIQEKQNIGVFTFANLDGLKKTSGGFEATALSGEAVSVADAEVRQGVLEASSADMATEISNMIVQERAYQLNAKMVVMTDEVMQTVNNLR
jgi:flagellar basal-body rod protein FlgG